MELKKDFVFSFDKFKSKNTYFFRSYLEILWGTKFIDATN